MTPRCDIVIKTWYNDLCWVSYAIRFLEKNWNEPDSRIIVLAQPDCKEVIESWRFSSRVEYFYCNSWPDGNQFQGYLTLLADNFTDAELVAYFDSDTMLLEPIRIADELENGKPVIYYRPYGSGGEQERVAEQKWRPIMEYWLGVRPEVDYMQRFPFIYWTDTLAKVRRLVTSKTRKSLLDSLYSSVPYRVENFGVHPFIFSEHDVIGFYAALHESDRYALRNVTEAKSWPVKQYISWTQWSEDRITELNSYLAEGYDPQKIPTKKTTEGWTILVNDARDGHSSLVEQQGKIDVDVGGLPTHVFVRPYLKPGSTVIDVGAHIGNFTIPAMRAVGKDGLVIAYEPHPSIFSALEANVKKERTDNPNAAPCVMFNYALGSERATRSLHCNPLNYASNTLLEGILGPAYVTVDTFTLDESLQKLGLLAEISFVKMDCEGGEYGVLRGATKVIERYHPVLFTELSENFLPLVGITEQQFFDYLYSLGYKGLVPFPQEWVDAGHHMHDLLVLP